MFDYLKGFQEQRIKHSVHINQKFDIATIVRKAQNRASSTMKEQAYLTHMAKGYQMDGQSSKSKNEGRVSMLDK